MHVLHILCHAYVPIVYFWNHLEIWLVQMRDMIGTDKKYKKQGNCSRKWGSSRWAAVFESHCCPIQQHQLQDGPGLSVPVHSSCAQNYVVARRTSCRSVAWAVFNWFQIQWQMKINHYSKNRFLAKARQPSVPCLLCTKPFMIWGPWSEVMPYHSCLMIPPSTHLCI